MKHYDHYTTGEWYHIFNRANSQQDKLFYQERNYTYFLKKWHYYLGNYFDIWSYCLIPNHFHFLVRVTKGDNEEITENMRRFSIGYNQAINKQENRRGSLFQEHPKRVLITREAHLYWMLYYIHNNPVHHDITQEPWQWRYSSIQALSGNMSTKLAREEVLKLFGSLEDFLNFHKQEQDFKNIGYCLIESNEG